MTFQKAYKTMRRAFWQFKVPCFMFEVCPKNWKVSRQQPGWDKLENVIGYDYLVINLNNHPVK
jgi:hypothetical protein